MQREKYIGVILALDTASEKTGYAIYRNGKIIKSGVWKLNNKDPYADLFRMITATVEKYSITQIVAEDIFKHENKKYDNAFLVLAECRGVVKCSAEVKNITVRFISPIAVKQHMIGTSKWRKDESDKQARERLKLAMIKAVERLGYSPAGDDEADALGLLIAHIDSWRYEIIHPKDKNAL